MTLPTVPSHAVEMAPAVGASGLLQAGLGMLLVLGLIFGCAWLARRFGLQRFGGGGQVVKVVSSASVGQRERVVVVEVAGTWLVLGVTSSQVNTLHSLPAQAVPGTVAAPAAAARRPVDLFAQKLRESLTGKARAASW
jgi:flagellar protein FliO/FliZ